jgi:hypothetical protein
MTPLFTEKPFRLRQSGSFLFCENEFVLCTQNRHHFFLVMWVVIAKAYCFCNVVKSLFRIIMHKTEFTKPELTFLFCEIGYTL